MEIRVVPSRAGWAFRPPVRQAITLTPKRRRPAVGLERPGCIYILEGPEGIYIGETVSYEQRMKQHRSFVRRKLHPLSRIDSSYVLVELEAMPVRARREVEHEWHLCFDAFKNVVSQPSLHRAKWKREH